jgi:solute carrier family 35 protein C2
LHRSRSSSDKEAGGGRDGGGEVLFSSGDDSGYGGVDAEDGGGEGLEVHLASLEQKKAIWWKNVIVTAMFILSWCVGSSVSSLSIVPEAEIHRYTFATLLSIYNKWMFSPQYYGFSYPLFVTFCHMIVQFCLAGIIRAAFPRQFKPVERPTRQEYV